MAQNFQPSSFIPKKTLPTSPIKGERSKKPVNALSLIAGILFIISLIGAVGVFLYERFVISSVENQKTSLERARDAFEPRLIEELARLDVRMDVAENLLGAHITVSPFFELLGTLTLKSVRFKSFEFTRAEGGELNISMEGISDNYTAIALQSDLFGNNEHIKDPIFSGFKLNTDGGVSFQVQLSVDNSLLLYVNNF